jgi:hypothetical protein
MPVEESWKTNINLEVTSDNNHAPRGGPRCVCEAWRLRRAVYVTNSESRICIKQRVKTGVEHRLCCAKGTLVIMNVFKSEFCHERLQRGIGERISEYCERIKGL